MNIGQTRGDRNVRVSFLSSEIQSLNRKLNQVTRQVVWKSSPLAFAIPMTHRTPISYPRPHRSPRRNIGPGRRNWENGPTRRSSRQLSSSSTNRYQFSSRTRSKQIGVAVHRRLWRTWRERCGCRGGVELILVGVVVKVKYISDVILPTRSCKHTGRG